MSEMNAPQRITRDTDDETKLNRIGEMQQDLGFLFTVNWCDVSRELQISVLKHALIQLTNDQENGD